MESGSVLRGNSCVLIYFVFFYIAAVQGLRTALQLERHFGGKDFCRRTELCGCLQFRLFADDAALYCHFRRDGSRFDEYTRPVSGGAFGQKDPRRKFLPGGLLFPGCNVHADDRLYF